jgi:hypothetical protein
MSTGSAKDNIFLATIKWAISAQGNKKSNRDKFPKKDKDSQSKPEWKKPILLTNKNKKF